MGWFKKDAVSLGGHRGGNEVSLRARIASANVLTSPFNGFEAAVVHLTVGTRLTFSGGQSQNETVTFREVGSVVLAADLELTAKEDGALVRVLAAGLFVEPVAKLETAMPLERPPPPELAALVARASAGDGVVCVRETTLRRGDEVRLRAHVDEERGVVASGYRSDVGVVWVARADLGPVVLEELLETPGW